MRAERGGRPGSPSRASAGWGLLLWILCVACSAPAAEPGATPGAIPGVDRPRDADPPAAARSAGEHAGAVEITFLDIGQGDAVLVRSPEGRTALIDAGGGDPVEQLDALGVERIDLLVATHPHADHIGGMEEVLAAYPVRFYMDNGQPHTTATYLGLARVLRRRTDIAYLEAVERVVSLGSVTLEVLPLPPAETVDHNDRSVTIVVRLGSFSALLSGDSETKELGHFVRRGLVPDVTVLKAAHHGSRNGFTRAFLEAAAPEVVVISLGSNSYGHPHGEASRAYASVAAEVYRTDRDGRVTVLGYEDGSYVVRTER